MEYIRKRWRRTALRATSIGAWFALLAFGDAPPEQALLVSPVGDQKRIATPAVAVAGGATHLVVGRPILAAADPVAAARAIRAEMGI